MRREIGVLLGVTIVVNASIGTGIFKMPADTVRLAGSLSASFAMWAVGGLIALCGALSLAELAAAIPRSGGLCEYLRRAYGPTVAFLFGWAELTLLIPSAVGSFAKLAAEALAPLFRLGPGAVPWISVFIVCACTAANLFDVRSSARWQAWLSAVKYAGVALLALAGLCAPLDPAARAALPVAAAGAYRAAPSLTGCFAALVSVMWAYDGWSNLAGVAGEARDPARTLPRALVLGTCLVALVYLAANLGYARALGLSGLRGSISGLAAANLADVTLGARGRGLLEVLIVLSCLGGCMSSLLTDSRVFVPLSTERVFPRAIGQVSPITGVPSRAVLICGALGASYVLLRSFEQLADAFVVGFFPFYILGVCAVPVLRRREPDLPRPFRVPAYPLVPLVFLAGAAALLCGAFSGVDRTALYAFAIMGLGLPLRFLWGRWARLA